MPIGDHPTQRCGLTTRITITRRALLRAGLGSGLALLAGSSTAATKKPTGTIARGSEEPMTNKLKVSVVQFRSGTDLSDNTLRHCKLIEQCAREGSRVVVFPECSLTGFTDDAVTKVGQTELTKAESTLCAAAKEAGVYAIVGAPTKAEKLIYNSALVITPKGEIIERYHKVHLAGEKWATPGDHISVFPIDGVLCSIIICHDERYPELVRLPVIAGARVVFYISCESGLNEEHKIAPYRAQVMARAVENGVYLVHSNAPADKEGNGGSHGQSRIVKPDGNLIHEAGIREEEVISAELDIIKASGAYARMSTECPFLRDWWTAGVGKVRKVSG